MGQRKIYQYKDNLYWFVERGYNESFEQPIEKFVGVVDAICLLECQETGIIYSFTEKQFKQCFSKVNYKIVVDKEMVFEEPKREFEIISYFFDGLTKDGNYVDRANTETYFIDTKNGTIPNKIQSVKRISDATEFTVGDRQDTQCSQLDMKIDSFYISEKGGLLVKLRSTQKLTERVTRDIDLNSLKAPNKKLLFITEDGKEVFDGDRCTDELKYGLYPYVDEEFNLSECDPKSKIANGEYPGKKMFSSLKIAQEYILMNKPLFSFRDIEQNYRGSIMETFEQLGKIGKGRLNYKE